MGSRGGRLLCASAAIGAALALPAPANAAQRLITIDVPSRFVDVTKVKWAGARHPKKLQANVLLPDGYDGKRRFPLLLLLHGADGRWDSWASDGGGQIRRTAAGLDAIVVMPD